MVTMMVAFLPFMYLERRCKSTHDVLESGFNRNEPRANCTGLQCECEKTLSLVLLRSVLPQHERVFIVKCLSHWDHDLALIRLERTKDSWS